MSAGGLVFSALLSFVLVTAEPSPRVELRMESTAIDAKTTRAGLAARLGARARRHTIEVLETTQPSTVRVRVTGPRGTSDERTLKLQGETPEARGRELAAAAALLVDGLERAPRPATSHAANARTHASTPNPRPARLGRFSPPTRPVFFAAGVLRTAVRLEREASTDIGLGAMAGVFVYRRHLAPFVEGTWSAAIGEKPFFLQHTRLGAGLLAGTLVHPDVWLGGAVSASALLARTEGPVQTSRWLSSLGVAAALAYFGPKRLFVLARPGIELTIPAFEAKRGHHELRIDLVRPALHVAVGAFF